MKYIRITLVVLAALAVLGVAGWYFVGWSLNRAFQSGGWPSFELLGISMKWAAPPLPVLQRWAPRTPIPGSLFTAKPSAFMLHRSGGEKNLPMPGSRSAQPSNTAKAGAAAFGVMQSEQSRARPRPG